MEWSFKHHHFPKPTDENGYLEAMSKIVFSTGEETPELVTLAEKSHKK